MAERPVVTMRLHPEVWRLLKERAEERRRSLGYLVEEMAKQFLGLALGDFEPGQGVADGDGNG